MTHLIPPLSTPSPRFVRVFSFTPQALKIWRERDASSVLTRMYIITVADFTFWWPVACS
jgi:MtN3 and saliva related transmembrane protein